MAEVGVASAMKAAAPEEQVASVAVQQVLEAPSEAGAAAIAAVATSRETRRR